ncbi:hypothetical protein E2C01_067993 [Portunus trituberculatus]|uniref:Uncharacterized protein n=1 Tax=Portunus trituberculatus TaxID=210409 RepID=A0A5B7HWQ2_PORTR|nr:hypothetical protein [Portunus trituberculatus]
MTGGDTGQVWLRCVQVEKSNAWSLVTPRRATSTCSAVCLPGGAWEGIRASLTLPRDFVDKYLLDGLFGS